MGDWAPVAPCALSFSFPFLFHSVPSSSSPYHLPASTPYHISFYSPLSSPRHFFYVTASWTVLFLSFVAFPQACTADLPTSLDCLPDSLLSFSYYLLFRSRPPLLSSTESSTLLRCVDMPFLFPFYNRSLFSSPENARYSLLSMKY